MLILYLSTMLLCLGIECWPALAGVDTLPGTYPLTLMPVEEPEYRGDVLAYRETDTIIYSIHRTYPGREKMYTLPDEKRRRITNGCINIEPNVYDRLVKEQVYQLEIIP
jgi:hypothetical protein